MSVAESRLWEAEEVVQAHRARVERIRTDHGVGSPAVRAALIELEDAEAYLIRARSALTREQAEKAQEPRGDVRRVETPIRRGKPRKGLRHEMSGRRER